MDIRKTQKSSATIDQGQWVEDIPKMGDLRLLVRGLSSPTALALRSRLERAVPFEDRERDGSLKPEAQLRTLRATLSGAVLLGWDNLSDGGELLAFGQDVADRYIGDPDFEEFADAVVWAARVVDRGAGANKEALKKTS